MKILQEIRKEIKWLQFYRGLCFVIMIIALSALLYFSTIEY